MTTSKHKATHKGTCQCCGALQKLPDGVLAKHGYTVKWGFFEGVCRGSNELPFEKSCKLIEKFIAQARERLASVEQQIAQYSAPATEAKAWKSCYRPGTWQIRSGYFWHLLDLHTEEKTSISDPTYKWTVVQYINPEVDVMTRKANKLTEEDTIHPERGESVLTVATEMNRVYVERALNPLKKQILDYIAWQTERVRTWKETDLKEIK